MATRRGAVSFRPGGGSFERLHPRDRRGRFREVIGGLRPGGGTRFGMVTIERMPGDPEVYHLRRPGQVGYTEARGLDRAARAAVALEDEETREVESGGGVVARTRSAVAATRERARAAGVDPDAPITGERRGLTPGEEKMMRRAFGDKKYEEIERKLAREREIQAKPEAERTTLEKLELLKVGQPAYGLRVSVRRTGEDEWTIPEAIDRMYRYQTREEMKGGAAEIAAEIDRLTEEEREAKSQSSRYTADMSLRGGKDPFRGRVTLNLRLVPSDWAVEHGYAEWEDATEKGLAYRRFKWKPGTDVERVVVHYLGGVKPPENFPTGSRGEQQFTWHKVKGKKAEREKLLRKIVAALVARQHGNPAKADRLLREADRMWREAEPEGEALVEAVPTYIERLHPRDRLGRWRDVPGVEVRKGVAYFPSFESARDVRDELPGSRIVNYERGYAIQLSRSGAYVGPEADEDTRLHVPAVRPDIRGPRAGDRPAQAAAAAQSAEQARQTAARLRAEGNEEHARDYDEMAARFDARAARLRGRAPA